MISATTFSYNEFSVQGTLINDSTQVKRQLDKLAVQAGNGLVSTTYAGLGSGAGVALNVSPQIDALQTYQSNISLVTTRMSVTQNAMTQLQQIAMNFAGKMPNLDGLNLSEVDSLAANARDALQQVADILNTRDGNTYVFSGQDGSNPPVPLGDAILSSGFYTQINAAVSSLSTNGASATAAATLQIASSNSPSVSPFSAYLSQPASQIGVPQINLGSSGTQVVGMIASANTAIVSTGNSTTGSYVRDLMRSLATLGSLSSSQVNDPGFAYLVRDTTVSLNGAVLAMSADTGIMGDRQSALTKLSASLSATQTALTQQVSAVQNVDMAATLSALTSTETQLQASYKLISTINSMSLVNYLPA